jgi:hypothetical protein
MDMPNAAMCDTTARFSTAGWMQLALPKKNPRSIVWLL